MAYIQEEEEEEEEDGLNWQRYAYWKTLVLYYGGIRFESWNTECPDFFSQWFQAK
jgi:hypothetical protein